LDDVDDGEDDYDDDYNFVEDEAREYGRENVGPVANPYLMPYVYRRHFLDTQYGVRKDGDMFMIGDSPIVVDSDGDITIKERVFKGLKCLWELWTKDDLKTYKKILAMTNAHLTKYEPESIINITPAKKFGISLRLFLRNQRDARSNLRYDVSG